MKVRVIESFNTAKGTIPKGAVVDIPETLFDRLQGKVVKIPLAESRKPISESRRKTLAAVADAILGQAVIDIQHGGIWTNTPDISVLEDEITRLHRLLIEGLTSLESFRQAVEQWKDTGTQMIKH
jgi:hypothetical protein